MSHNFLFSTYDYISRQLSEVEKTLTRVDADEATRQYAAGQIDILCKFERFMGERFEPKLPKRLRKPHADAPAACRRLAAKD